MAVKEGLVIDINRGYYYEDGVKSVKGLIFDGTNARIAIFNGVRVFNRADYYFYLPDTEVLVPADGSPVSVNGIVSYKTDYDGIKTDVGYEGGTLELDPNTSSSEKTGTFNVVQNMSGFTLTGNYRQPANKVTYEYSSLAIASVIYMSIAATGGTRKPRVNYTYKRREVYSSGGYGAWEPKSGHTDTFDDIDGSALVDYATFNESTGEVYAENLHTTPTIETNVAVVTYVKISAFGMDEDWSGSLFCVQLANNRKPVDTAYSLSISADNQAPTASDKTVLISVSSFSKTRYLYDTGEYGYGDNVASAASLTTTVGSVNPASVSGSGTTTLTMGVNTDEAPRVIRVTGTAADNKTTDYVDITQSADSVSYEWDAPVISSISCADVGADGSEAQVYATYTQKQYKVTAAGRELYDTDSGTVAVTSASGSTEANSGALNGTTVKAASLGTTLQNRRVVFTVKSVTIKVNGVTGTSSGKSCRVYQEANKRSLSSQAYSLTCTPSTKDVANTGGTIVLSVVATRTDSYVYTSGAEKTTSPQKDTAAISATGGTLSAASVTGEGSVNWTIGENYIEEAVKYSVTAILGDKKVSVPVTQAAAVYELEFLTLGAAPADGGEITMTVLSTRNGGEQAFDVDHVSTSGLSGVKVNSVTPDGNGEYSISLYVPANGTSDSRSFTIKVTQPNSGRVKSSSITQSGVTVVREKVAVIANPRPTINRDYTSVSYSIRFSAADTSAYTGEAIRKVFVTLNSKADGSGTVYDMESFADTINVGTGGTSSTYSGTLTSTAGTWNVYVLVYFDGDIQFSTQPMVEIEEM